MAGTASRPAGLLRRAIGDRSQYAVRRDDGEDQDLMEDLMILNTVKSPLTWLKYSLDYGGEDALATPKLRRKRDGSPRRGSSLGNRNGSSASFEFCSGATTPTP